MTAIAFLLPHLKLLSTQYQIYLVTNSADPQIFNNLGLNITVLSAPVEREIKPLIDMRALLALFRLFKKNKFDAVHSVTPKAGMLAMLAAWAAKVPMRTHVFTGQVWATKSGFRRSVLKTADKITAHFASHVLIDSLSQQEFLLAEDVVSLEKSAVIANGSICGVNTQRFCPDQNEREIVRQELSIPSNGMVLLYLGRLKYEKGILELAQAFVALSQTEKNLWLLLVGPDEDDLAQHVANICANAKQRIVFVGQTNRPERYMAASDIFCLPSYREGFGSSVIEAAACGVPAVASRIYGLTDAVEDGVTGLLHTPRDPDSLSIQLRSLIDQPSLRLKMGESARRRVINLFQEQCVTTAQLEFYKKNLGG